MISTQGRAFQPYFGGVVSGGAARFRVWAPAARRLDLVLSCEGGDVVHGMEPSASGVFERWVPDATSGAPYRYRIDDAQLLPDPASRYQPEGVRGPSMLIDPSSFRWTDDAWTGPRGRNIVLYELHVGTFTPEGSFAGVHARLDALAALGITTIELMPLAEFAGRWNWGYDGVDLFAPSHRYGTPDDLRRLVDAAHSRGLSVIVDVVYNHFGPDGAYIHTFSPYFQAGGHHTPWGAAINLDGPHSEMVRRFFIDNALHWIHEYHMDGLRLDATHALRDAGAVHFLAELADAVHGSAAERRLLVFAEDERNDATLVRDRDLGGFALDGVWADDFHHHVRRAVAGDNEGYYRSYSGTTADIAATVRSGWFFRGQHCEHLHARRGTDAEGIPLERFVACVQNHDQVGNRAFGERLHHEIAPEVYRAVSTLLLLAPETPLLFMGQEWAASTPFRYFTDHTEELGRAVTEGRRSEFADFSAFADDRARSRIPDPQDAETFRGSILRWDERDRPPHVHVLALYRDLLRLRRTILTGHDANLIDARAIDADTLLVAWTAPATKSTIVVVVHLRGGEVDVALDRDLGDPTAGWDVLLTTDDSPYAEGGRAPSVQVDERVRVRFPRAGAIVLRANEEAARSARPHRGD